MRLAPAILLVSLLAAPLAASDGDFDSTFYADGTTAFSSSDGFEPVGRLRAAPDGRLSSGYIRMEGADHWIGRIAVGDSGIPTACPDWASGNHQPYAVVDQLFDGSGRLLQLIAATNLSTGHRTALLARYPYPSCTWTGSLDGTHPFLDLGVWDDYTDFDPTSLALQSDGKILVGGWATRSGQGGEDGFVIRLLESGLPDASFDGDGRYEISNERDSADQRVTAIAATPNGMIVAAGHTRLAPADLDVLVLAFPTAGSGVSGIVLPIDLGTTDARQDDVVTSLAVRPDGGVVVGGYAETDGGTEAFLLSLDWSSSVPPGLAFDTDFGPNGLRHLGFASSNSGIADLVVQGDGKIVAAGWALASGDYEMAVARFQPTGALDPTFFPTQITYGLRYISYDLAPPDRDVATGVALQGGRIAVVGSVDGVGKPYAGFARLRNSYIFADGFESGGARLWSGGAGVP